MEERASPIPSRRLKRYFGCISLRLAPYVIAAITALLGFVDVMAALTLFGRNDIWMIDDFFSNRQKQMSGWIHMIMGIIDLLAAGCLQYGYSNKKSTRVLLWMILVGITVPMEFIYYVSATLGWVLSGRMLFAFWIYGLASLSLECYNWAVIFVVHEKLAEEYPVWLER